MAQATTHRPDRSAGAVSAPPRAGEAALRAHSRRFAGLLRGAGTGREPVAGMRWTVGEIGAHIAQSASDATTVAEGGTSAYAGGEFDARVDERLVAALPERDPGRLADMIETRYEAAIEALATHPDDARIGLAGGFSPAAARSVLTLDFLLHGSQIAATTGQAWEVPAGAVRDGVAAVLPFLVDETATRGVTATYSVTFRGAAPLVYGFDAGRLFVDDGGGRRVDCRISADPASFLLLGIGVVPQWRLVLTGKLASYGWKPWLAMRIQRYFPAVPHGGVAAR